jgi:hypothetical protein
MRNYLVPGNPFALARLQVLVRTLVSALVRCHLVAPR